jgi:formamidase
VASHELHADLSIPVSREPTRCHNRWHPDIPPALVCHPGDDVVVTTRDAVDGQLSMDSTHEDLRRTDRTLVHPLTGPIFVKGVGPGDLLVVDILDVQPGAFGYTAQFPGFGFLSDEFPDPFLARWEIADGWATSPDLPGVRIPGRPFMGILGLAPSRDLLERISDRERELAAEGVDVALPDPRGAVPADNDVATEGLRTKPPRENGGNIDVKHIVAGTRALFPVWTEGALFSTGDAHFAQGDGEVCGTAIETTATLHVRLDVIKGAAAARGVRDLKIFGTARPAGGDYVATTGLSLYAGEGRSEDMTVAARSALRNMIDHLEDEYGYTRQQGYAICSVAVDLKLSEIVDSPNYVVTAELPLEVLT